MRKLFGVLILALPLVLAACEDEGVYEESASQNAVAE